ncbi:MAG TPA: hypothetical protein VG267_12610 [Terracidiphilus sp.]|jgi:hypothetical protein|nr:hypothetical protein [Terracidiphilus sp.]
MLPHVTAILLLRAGVPLMQKLFPPLPPIEQLKHTPVLIVGVLGCCLAAAFLALWLAAPDYRVFRSLGVCRA